MWKFQSSNLLSLSLLQEELRDQTETVAKLKQRLAEKKQEFSQWREEAIEELDKVRFEHMFCESWRNGLLGHLLTDEELYVSKTGVSFHLSAFSLSLS